MKVQQLLIPMLLLSACRTTAGTKDKPNNAKPYAAQSEMLLQKIIGGFDGESREHGQYFECKVMDDIAEAVQVRKWIAEMPRKTINGYHIIAKSPSIQRYAFEGKHKLVIYTDWSQIEEAKAESDTEKNAIIELNKIIEKYCPDPEKPSGKLQ